MIQSLDDYDFIIAAGDFNARIGSKNDFISDIDDISNRVAIDEITNKHGEAFLEFLIDNKMAVLNGRIGVDDFTCVRPQGRSVVDYCFTTHEGFKYIESFYVKRVSEVLSEILWKPNCSIPDHSLLICDVDLSEFRICQSSPYVKESIEPFPYSKEYIFSELPLDFMNNDQVRQCVTDIVKSLNVSNPPQILVNNLYKDFIGLLNVEMERCLKKVKNKSSKNNRNICPFWDNDLNNLYKEATKAEKEFCKCAKVNKNVLHNEFKTKQKSFDKAFRRAKRAFLRKNEIELESMVTNNGKDMWKKVEQLGAKGKSQCIVPSEVIKNEKVCTDETQVLKQWKDDFSSLYQGTTDNALGLDIAFLD